MIKFKNHNFNLSMFNARAPYPNVNEYIFVNYV